MDLELVFDESKLTAREAQLLRALFASELRWRTAVGRVMQVVAKRIDDVDLDPVLFGRRATGDDDLANSLADSFPDLGIRVVRRG